MMGDNVVLPEEGNVTLRVRIVSQNSVGTAEKTVDLSSALLTLNEVETVNGAEALVSAFLNDGEYLVVLLRNGDLHRLWKGMGDTAQIELTEPIAPAEQIFYRIELLGRPPTDFINALLGGFTKALSNPIYFNYSN
jgi:hypothetical protein